MAEMNSVDRVIGNPGLSCLHIMRLKTVVSYLCSQRMYSSNHSQTELLTMRLFSIHSLISWSRAQLLLSLHGGSLSIYISLHKVFGYSEPLLKQVEACNWRKLYLSLHLIWKVQFQVVMPSPQQIWNEECSFVLRSISYIPSQLISPNPNENAVLSFH